MMFEVNESQYKRLEYIENHLRSKTVDKEYLQELRKLIKEYLTENERRKIYQLISVYQTYHLSKEPNVWLKGYIIYLKEKLESEKGL